MPQISNRNEPHKSGENVESAIDENKNLANKSVRSVERVGERMVDSAGNAAEQSRATAERMVHDATSTMGRGLDAAADAAGKAAGLAGPASREALKAESDLVSLWLSLTRDQVQHNVETWRRMSAVRDVREFVEIQGEYVRVSLSRITQGLTKQVDTAGRMFKVTSRVADRLA